MEETMQSSLFVAGVCAFMTTLAVPAQGPGQYLEDAKLAAPLGMEAGKFGAAVAISGDIVVVGETQFEFGFVTGQGVAHVYQRTVGGLSRLGLLSASDGIVADQFGVSVAIGGDTIVVGADRAGVSGLRRGAVYVFEKPPGGWADMTETAKLVSSNGRRQLGASVAIDGDTVVAGEHLDATGLWSVCVFEKPGGGWVDMTETAKLRGSDAFPAIVSGAVNVAVSGDTVVAGGGTFSPLGLYVFEKPGSGWVSGPEVAKLTSTSNFFFRGVSISGDTIVAGATSGSASVFIRPGSGWASTSTENALLAPSDPAPNNRFGAAVSFDGGTVVVGAATASGGTTQHGAVYVYEKPPSGWGSANEDRKIVPADGAINDEFGFAVALDQGVVVVGALRNNAGGLNDAGAAYVFEAPDVVVNSGCGLPAVDLAGSKRIGGVLRMSLTTCSSEATPRYAIGTPRTQPVPVPTGIACGDFLGCQLLCAPAVILTGESIAITVEGDPGLVGLTLCVQGMCFEPVGCVRVTDLTRFTVSR